MHKILYSLSLDDIEAIPALQSRPNLRPVRVNATSITSHLEGLARNCSTHVGASDLREECGSSKVVDPLLPLLLSLLGWVDILDALTLGLLNGVADPADLDLDSRWAVREQRWTMGTVKMEEVGVACTQVLEVDVNVSSAEMLTRDCCSQICVCGRLPLILEVGSVDGLQAHVCQSTSNNIEAGGESNDVKFLFLAIGNDTLLSEALDRGSVRLVDVDDRDVVTVQHFVVVLLQARSLHTEWMRWLLREENLLLLFVLDTSALLLAPVVVRLEI